jgi:hypothetical protein
MRCYRILDEAITHGMHDPVHVAPMFGLHPDTAQRYTGAAYGLGSSQTVT